MENSKCLSLKTYEFCTDELSEKLCIKLYEQQKLGHLCDVILLHDETKVLAHSCILASFSPFFMRYFITLNKGGVTGKIVSHAYKLPITHITKCQTFSKNNCMVCIASIVKYLYTGKIKINSDHIDHIINISCNLEIKELISFCHKFSEIGTLFNKSINHSDLNKPLKTDASSKDSVSLGNVLSNESLDSFIALPSPQTNSPLNSCTSSTSAFLVYKDKETHATTTSRKSLFCYKCDQSFADQDMLKYHKLIFHSKPFYCFYCDFKTHKMVFLLEHLFQINNHNRFLCSICLHSADNVENIMNHFSEHQHRYPYLCKFCENRFKDKIPWKNHLLQHSVVTPYKCPVCDAFFKKKSTLKMHILGIHRSQLRFCELCNFSTRFPASLERHKLKHQKKFLSCSVPDCNFKTSRKDNLKVHLLTHTSCKRLVCSVCRLTFSCQRNLKRHMRMHDSTLSTLKCPDCNYENKRQDKIKEHCLRMHGDKSSLLEDIEKQCIKRSNNSEENLLIKHHMTEINNLDLPSKCFEETSSKNRVYNIEVTSEVKESMQNSRTFVQYLNESTGELTVLCDETGNPLTGNLYSVHNMTESNFKKSEVVCMKPVAQSTKEVVILNEMTGELSVGVITEEESPNLEYNSKNSVSTVTLLDETTGEILSTQENPEDHDKVTQIFDNIFDSVDFDAMNEDSFDGFDGFDDFLFETNTNIGTNNSVMDKILNEVTGELFSGEISSPQKEESPFWNIVPSLNKDFMSADSKNVFSEIFLNEVTGEFTPAK